MIERTPADCRSAWVHLGRVPVTVYLKSRLRAQRMGIPEKHTEIYHPSPVGMSMGAWAHTRTPHAHSNLKGNGYASVYDIGGILSYKGKNVK